MDTAFFLNIERGNSVGCELGELRELTTQHGLRFALSPTLLAELVVGLGDRAERRDRLASYLDAVGPPLLLELDSIEGWGWIREHTAAGSDFLGFLGQLEGMAQSMATHAGALAAESERAQGLQRPLSGAEAREAVAAASAQIEPLLAMLAELPLQEQWVKPAVDQLRNVLREAADDPSVCMSAEERINAVLPEEAVRASQDRGLAFSLAQEVTSGRLKLEGAEGWHLDSTDAKLARAVKKDAGHQATFLRHSDVVDLLFVDKRSHHAIRTQHAHPVRRAGLQGRVLRNGTCRDCVERVIEWVGRQ